MRQQKQTPLMSIVVLNWNGLDDTKICLEHLRKLTYPNYEIIVVDNGSRQDSKDYLSQLSDITYVDNPKNRGFTGGHIDGLKHCKGEYIVLLNNDAVMQQDYLSKALEAFDDPQVAVVGGRSYFWNDENPILDENNAFYSYQNVNVVTGEAFMQQTDFNVPQVTNNVSGSAAVVRRTVIDEVGYLHDRFFAYFEETDLFARIKRAGYKIMYDPRLHIWHRNGASSGSSSGSHFFYYQIFRNRFIFAVRNFEGTSLSRFFLTYAKIAAGSLARLLLRPNSPNKTMYKAYAQAAAYNLFSLPYTLYSRHTLRTQLGKSTYNHTIYSEQTGISFIFDATKLSDKEITRLRSQLAADTNPLHEYVLVVPKGQSSDFDPNQPNLRFVVDRGYFTANPFNLGCLAARFDWMAICPNVQWCNQDYVSDAVATTLRSQAKVLAIGDKQSYASTLLVHKNLFVHLGGIEQADTHTAMTDGLLTYADRSQVLVWYNPHDSQLQTVPMPAPSADEKQVIGASIRRDRAFQRSQRITPFDRIKAKYYRIYQFTNLVRWLFLPTISLYLKAARIKNVLLFTVTLKRKALALELKHIRNEVILSTRSGIDVADQKRVINKQLAKLLKQPADMPVFIICRDRVDALRELVAWLEKKGFHKIVFVDNDSLYPPLVQYFQETPYQVIRLYRNVGHTSPWTLGMIRALIPEDFYIVSDPDVIPDKGCPKDVFSHFLKLHKKYFMYQKVGFGLRIDDLPDHYPLKKSVMEWEGQFWNNQLEPEVYEAGIDTTFATYKPFSYFYTLHPSIRTGHPYTACHLPWYADPKKISEEETHYRFRADHNVSSWNVDVLEDRYAKEMKKKKS
jgi:GT2 family glycosyltransferase